METNTEFKAVSWNREISKGLCFLASLDLMEPEVVGMVTCVEGFKPLGMTSHTTELKETSREEFFLGGGERNDWSVGSLLAQCSSNANS